MGSSNNMLLMHHHNILASPTGGKNLTRFITPHGSTVFGPTYTPKRGSIAEPQGDVFAPLIMGPLPWDQHMDQVVVCQASEQGMDLGVHTNASCLSALDLGVNMGWYPGTNAAIWRGNSDKHCQLCHIADKNSSHWQYKPLKGAITYAIQSKKSEASYKSMMKYDANGDGMIDEHDLRASMLNVEKLHEGKHEHKHKRSHEYRYRYEHEDKRDEYAAANDGDAFHNVYVLKNSNYFQGLNFTYINTPAYVGAGFVSGPPDAQGNNILYAMTSNCIARSFDKGETWAGCWNPPPLPTPTDAFGFIKSAGFLAAGHDLKPKVNTTLHDAEVWCQAQVNCTGITLMANASADPNTVREIWFKERPAAGGNGNSQWVSYTKPLPPPDLPYGNATGLQGKFNGLTIKNETFMIVTRAGQVPLRTTDGGKTWENMTSCSLVATYRHGTIYSWSGDTLILMGSGGTQSPEHPHAAFVWASNDDGETWRDETGDVVTMGPGAANWYEGDFYINSMGQGIMKKTLE